MTAISPIGMATQIAATFQATSPANVAGPDFTSMISNAAHSALQNLRQAEQVTASGIAGKTDTQAVVQALSNAEVTMQAVVAVRDKVLSAYNDIMHMNI